MNIRKVVISLLFFALIVVAVSLFWRNGLFLALLLVMMGFIKQKVSPIKKSLIWFAIVSVLGPTVEILIIWLGGNPWRYAAPDLFNVPMWLFPLYGLCGLNLITLYDGVTKSK